MNIIEKIRAEVERRIKSWSTRGENSPEGQGKDTCVSRVTELTDLLSFLDTLEKSEKPINPTIEKLRALIKMQIRREELNFASLGGGGQTMNIGALEWVLKQLDTLKEPINKWSNKERKARVKKTGEIVCGFTDGQGHFDIPTDHNEFIRYNLDELEFDTLQEQPVDLDNKTIMEEIRKLGCYPSEFDVARRFYELGKQSKQTEWTEKDKSILNNIVAYKYLNVDDLEWLKDIPNRIQQSKPTTAEGLEEELVKYIGYPEENLDGKWKKKEVEDIARHFAQWGAEHLKK